MPKVKYKVLSPDGFTIEMDTLYYPSMKKVNEAFYKWKKRFEFQGYYSSNRGRIPLEVLSEYCRIIEVPIKTRKK